ncbi:MAG: hypothetical protein WC640_01175 [Candidatus Paceibacterota bacterium]|jgi:hypothetical protein
MDEQKDNQIKDDWYLSLKVQKLTQAVYLVTSLISDNEPIKWRLREEALDILSDTTLSHDHHVSPLYKLPGLETVLLKVNHLLSFLEVSLAANFVSEMNLVLLKKEYLILKQSLEEKAKENNVGRLLELSPLDQILPNNSSNNSRLNSQTLSDRHNLVGKKQVEYLKINRLPHKNRDLAKDSRRSIILDFLKGKDWTSIKDITEAVDGCSAKTIQRELADLVQKGVLKKKGDRRWSRYLLA